MGKDKKVEDKEKREKKQEVDIFRDTPLRYLGYANELGESFRAVIDKKLVHLSYVVASGYVLADTISKSKKTYGETCDSMVTTKTAVDVLLWQSFASVIIPGFTINRICAGTRWGLKKADLFCKYRKWIVVTVGLMSIPVIIHPIDHSVDYIMDKTVRPAMGIK